MPIFKELISLTKLTLDKYLIKFENQKSQKEIE
jgi:hypothetical protein